jgi:hypothetical protein
MGLKMPYEEAYVATLHFIEKLMEIQAAKRATMSEENRNALDALELGHMQRAAEAISFFHNAIKTAVESTK